MNTLDLNSAQRRLMESVLATLTPLGYRDELVARDYEYRDRFVKRHSERRIGAALFGRTPVSYETALIGVAEANGSHGATLVNEHRSLGAPVVLEVQDDTIGIWAVGRDQKATKLERWVDEDGFRRWVETHERDLRPTEFLRTKEGFRGGPAFFQPSLFAGLIPELEGKISRSLDPILRHAFKAGADAYKEAAGEDAPEPELFRLAFWILTGKVFADRNHEEFADLNALSSPEMVLRRVAKHYNQTRYKFLNHSAREAVFGRIWNRMDFRNLSVEVLSQIWSKTLVSKETRKKLGIHRTRRSIVRYIVDRIPFEAFALEERRVLEPCSGSATFLIAALDRMRDIPPEMPDPATRHAYFQRMLTGFERDPFGVEIGSLCLALADYPNPNGWDIRAVNIFKSPQFAPACEEARIVLCNPPFEDFDDQEYEEVRATTKHKPAELLGRILDSLHPEGVLGFVLPRSFLDHRGYAPIRRRIVDRYASLDLLSLPGRLWEHADKETVLLIATNPVAHSKAAVSFARVKEKDSREFDWFHAVSFRAKEDKSTDDAARSLAVLELKEAWVYLDSCPRLREVAEVRKGIEWNKDQEENRDLLVRSQPLEGHDFRLGVPPQASPFLAFERPPVAYLNFDKDHQRRPKSFKRPWSRPKVIMSRGRKSRPGPWKLAAFADFEGLACFETFIAVWPHDNRMIIPVAAVLNGPVANAFMADRETGPHIVKRTLLDIPVPFFSDEQKTELKNLVADYHTIVGGHTRVRRSSGRSDPATRILQQIDAIVLSAYGLPPRIERLLLDYFNGYGNRPVRYDFGDYFPAELESYVSLEVFISEAYSRSTAEDFIRNAPDVTDPTLLEILGDLG